MECAAFLIILMAAAQVSSAINNVGANNGYTSATNAPHLRFRATSATQWYVMSDVAG